MKFKYHLPFLLFMISAIPFFQIEAQDVGIGTTNPDFKLDVAGRMRLRHEGGSVTSGLWFNKSDNTAYTFSGMRSDSIWGLYAIGYKFNFDMENSRLGIGAIIPQYPLAIENGLGDRISLYGGGGLPNADHYGFGIQASLMQLFTPASNTDIAFGYGRSAAFTERMRIKGNGNVGIGNTNPVDAGLIVDKKVGSVNAMFGRNTTGVSIESNYPGIGFNCYYNGSRKTIATGYTSLINADPVNGNLGLYNSNVSTAADATATLLPRLIIDKDGDIGVEGNTTPHAPLSFANLVGNKISLFGSVESSNYGFGIQSSLMQMYTASSSTDIAFGYGGSTSFTEIMRIKGNGNVGIGTNAPTYKLDIESLGSGLMRLTNASPLALTTQTAMYFKTGSHYTGSIKTIGTSTAAARLGFFTYADANPASLVERLSISDDGYVGIGNTSPLRPLSFPAVLGKKISLYPGAAGDSGFGVFNAEFRMHSDHVGADITFGYDTYASGFTERVRIKGNGNVGIGTNAPAFLLDVNGRMRVKHNGVSSGVWFSNSLNNDDPGFIGMYNDTYTGFYGDGGAGWGFVMNTTNGNVGIGSLTPGNKLTVTGNTSNTGWFNNVNTNDGAAGIYASAISGSNGSGVRCFGQTGVEAYGIYTGGLVNIGVYGEANGGTTNYAGYFSGNVYTTGVYQSSDRKLKDNITQITNAIDIIRNLNPTIYTYKTTQYPHMYLPEGLQYGLIADEVLKVIPGAVTKAIQPAQYENHDKQNGRKLNDEVEFNAVNYTQMIPILIGGIQEQQNQIELQQLQIENQQQQIDDLKKLVGELAQKK